MESRENIHPVFDLILNRQDKESLLNKMGYLTQVLDGDNIRTGINNNLGFTQEDRIENIRRIAEVNKLFLNCGIICINSFISPTQEIRGIARKIIGKDDFIEVFANTPLSVCEKRDIKGLYKKAREGKIKNFTGIDSPFEAPQNAAVEIKTEIMTIEEAVQKVLDVILPKISKS
jgi:adenylylsulfate kinase